MVPRGSVSRLIVDSKDRGSSVADPSSFLLMKSEDIEAQLSSEDGYGVSLNETLRKEVMSSQESESRE